MSVRICNRFKLVAGSPPEMEATMERAISHTVSGVRDLPSIEFPATRIHIADRPLEPRLAVFKTGLAAVNR